MVKRLPDRVASYNIPKLRRIVGGDRTSLSLIWVIDSSTELVLISQPDSRQIIPITIKQFLPKPHASVRIRVGESQRSPEISDTLTPFTLVKPFPRSCIIITGSPNKQLALFA